MKYNKLDLVWLFEKEPICSEKVGTYDGIFNYSKKCDGFKLQIVFDIYENWINVYLEYFDKALFSANLICVTELLRCEENLIISVKDVPTLKLKFKEQLSVELLSLNEYNSKL